MQEGKRKAAREKESPAPAGHRVRVGLCPRAHRRKGRGGEKEGKARRHVILGARPDTAGARRGTGARYGAVKLPSGQSGRQREEEGGDRRAGPTWQREEERRRGRAGWASMAAGPRGRGWAGAKGKKKGGDWAGGGEWAERGKRKGRRKKKTFPGLFEVWEILERCKWF